LRVSGSSGRPVILQLEHDRYTKDGGKGGRAEMEELEKDPNSSSVDGRGGKALKLVLLHKRCFRPSLRKRVTRGL